MIRHHFECGQSAVTVICEEDYIPKVRQAVIECREIIIRHIEIDPFFATTYEPYVAESNDPVINRMSQASLISNVGPMASVAGAIAEYAVKAAIQEGAQFIVIDNGGDIALHTDRSITVGLHCGDPRLDRIGLRIEPCEGILGICTSSGKIGPSISFGMAEISTVISENVVLADALATHLGNLVKNGQKETLENALEQILRVKDIKSALVYADGNFAMRGELPDLVEVEPSPGLITKRVHVH